METSLLKYFTTVAEERNLGRAAIRLHITQPALTRKIQSLEEFFGTPLFKRTNAGMVMTPAGEALLFRAKNVMAEIELAKKETLTAGRITPVRIDIGVFGSAIFNIIPQILDRFISENPSIELSLHNAHKERQIESLCNGKIMIAFDRFLPEETDLIRETILQESPWVVLYKKHPLAGDSVVDINDLRDEFFIGGMDSKSMEKIIGFSPRPGQKVDDILTAIALVGCGFGFSFAPPSLQLLQIPNVVYRPLIKKLNFTFDLHCSYRKNENSPLLKAILDTVHSYCSEVKCIHGA